MTPVHPDDARRILQEAATRRVEAQREIASVAIDIGDAAITAYGVLPVAEMAALAGVSRPALYTMMRNRGWTGDAA